MKEEIITVIQPIAQGQPVPSLYALIPLEIRERRKITKETKLIILLAENGDLIYRKKEA